MVFSLLLGKPACSLKVVKLSICILTRPFSVPSRPRQHPVPGGVQKAAGESGKRKIHHADVKLQVTALSISKQPWRFRVRLLFIWVLSTRGRPLPISRTADAAQKAKIHQRYFSGPVDTGIRDKTDKKTEVQRNENNPYLSSEEKKLSLSDGLINHSLCVILQCF